jgi:hypothetical protein
MIRHPKPGTKVLVRGREEPVVVETVDGNAVWCTWEEDGQLRRGVFAKAELEKVG